MSRRPRVVGVLATVLLAGVAFAGAAEGAKVKNGNFEKGTFKNWKTETTDSGVMTRGVVSSNRWILYTKKTRTISSGARTAFPRGGGGGITLPKPKGKYSPVINMTGPGHNVLYRTLKIPSNAKTLKLKAYWHNEAGEWHFGGSFLEPSDGDQYFSIDLLDSKADPESTKKSDVLGNLYAPKTKPLKPPVVVRAGRLANQYVSGWKGFKTSVKKYQGEKVTLRLAETDSLSFNFVGIDNVKFGK